MYGLRGREREVSAITAQAAAGHLAQLVVDQRKQQPDRRSTRVCALGPQQDCGDRARRRSHAVLWCERAKLRRGGASGQGDLPGAVYIGLARSPEVAEAFGVMFNPVVSPELTYSTKSCCARRFACLA